MFAAALVAIGWAGYAVSMAADFGLTLPVSLTQAPLDVGPDGLGATGGLFNAPAAAVVILCVALLLAGMRVAARVNDLIVVAKIAAILVVGVAGLMFARGEHWSPFVPPNSGSFGEFGVSGVVAGAAIVFYAYVGFDAVSAMSQETRDAQRVVPWALIASLAICTLLYVLIALMVTGLADYRELGVPDPVYVALARAGSSLAWAKPMIGAVVVIGLISALLVTLLGQVRIFYAMARDGLLPPMFAAVDRRSRTPIAGTLVTGVVAALVAGAFPLRLLGELISIGTLLAFAIVCVGVIVLRRRRPDLERPFKAPGYPWTPLGGIAVCVVLMASLPTDTWLRLAVWLAIGAALYAGYGLRRSALSRQGAARGEPPQT
jgi:APA family basic amino acid/polyamine antiporter